jgi:hypothetical protein
MEAEQQIHSATMPSSAPRAQSDKLKSKRGGKRPGAGRKPNLAKRLLSGVKATTAADILSRIDTEAVVNDLLKNGSRQLKFQVIIVLWDRVYGKPKQDVRVTGGIVHAHTRDPFLASLPNEAVEALLKSYDEVKAKYLPSSQQDGSHNHTKSDAATNVIDVECEDVQPIQVPQNASNYNSEIPKPASKTDSGKID